MAKRNIFGYFILTIWCILFNCSLLHAQSLPNPPRNLQIDVISGEVVSLNWTSPVNSSVTAYKLTLVPLSKKDEIKVKHMQIYAGDQFPIKLQDLTPGGTYELQLHSLSNDLSSNLFVSANFTTKPNTPNGRFIVWFRNETALLVLWQPPHPSGIFDQYRVKIEPKDSSVSVLNVEKEFNPSGPAQAAFYGLIPGRAYNISVQTVSHEQISSPAEVQYRTVPLPPTNVTFDPSTATSTSFEIKWQPPKSPSEFDRYQVALSTKDSVLKTIVKESPRVVTFNENLDPGNTYEVVLKTVSGNVASLPISCNATTAPLPVTNLIALYGESGEIILSWTPNNNSIQDSYLIRYHEIDISNSDSSSKIVYEDKILLDKLLDGRNYSITVKAASKNVLSEGVTVYQPTKPAPPVIGILRPVANELSKLNVSWKSDVASRQDSYRVTWIRNDTNSSMNEAITKNNWLVLEELYPGGSYEINVSAMSYGLTSKPHTYFTTLPPRPPGPPHVVKTSNSSVLLTWARPSDTLFDHYFVRYRVVGSSLWREMNVTNATSTEIRDLIAGERYEFKVNTVSFNVESPSVQDVEQIMYPNAVESVTFTIAAENITFRLVTPLGRIDYYIIEYNTVREPTQRNSKQVLPRNNTKVGTLMTVVIDGLIAGELYSFRFYSVSHNLRSEGIAVQARTMTTNEDIQAKVGLLKFTNITMTSLNVHWDPPVKPNGSLAGYYVIYETYEPHGDFSKQVKQTVSANSLSVKGLKEYATYIFKVRAKTSLGMGPEQIGNVTTGPQAGSPPPVTHFTFYQTLTSVRLKWQNPNYGGIVGYLIEAQLYSGESGDWYPVQELRNGPQETYDLSYASLKASSRYTFRIMAISKFGISEPALPTDNGVIPSNLIITTPQQLELRPKLPFYFENWFVTSVAFVMIIITILFVAILCIFNTAYKYKQQAKKTESKNDLSENEFGLNENIHNIYASGFELRQNTLTSQRRSNSVLNSNGMAAAKCPPRPSPGSISYSDNDDIDDETKDVYLYGSSGDSVTEKPSELSSSGPESDSEHDEVNHFANHYANVNDTLVKGHPSWKHGPIASSSGMPSTSRSTNLPTRPPPPAPGPAPPSYRSAVALASIDERELDYPCVNLNGGSIIINNMAGSRAPLPGFSSFV